MKLYEEDKIMCFQISDNRIGFDKTNAISKDGFCEVTYCRKD